MAKAKLVGDAAAERVVLGGIAQYGKDAYLDVSDIVGIDSFSIDANKIIFKCLERTLESVDKPDIPSFLSAASELGLQQTISEKAEMEYVRGIFSLPILLDNVRSQAVKIRKLEIVRLAMGQTIQSYNLLSQITGKESIDEILSLLDKPLDEVTKQVNKTNNDYPTSIADGIDEYLQNLEDNPATVVGISTGFPRLDEAIGGGLRRGGVSLIGARPKTGKTTLAKTIACHVASLGIPVLMLDTEMNKRDQLNRCLATFSRVKTRTVETGQYSLVPKDKVKVRAAAEKIKKYPYDYHNISGREFPEILSICRRWMHRTVGKDENGNYKDCLIIYDYFKLMSSESLKDMQEFQVLGFQVSKLHDFCVQFDCPCLSFVQLNRDGLTKETSDIISQSDRLLWLCTSFSIFKRKTDEEMMEDGEENGNMKLIPLESRFGAGLQFGDYINLFMNGDISEIIEGKTRNELLKSQPYDADDTGFDLDESAPDLD